MATTLFTTLKKTSHFQKLLLRRFSVSVSFSKSTHSSLLISGRRAENTFVVVVPHLDFDLRFANLAVFEENLKRRKLDFNLSEMKESWEFYKDWNEKKVRVQENFIEAGKKVTQLSKATESEEKKKQLENLERYRGLLKEELQNIRMNVWNLEDNVIGELLKLPNVLHPEAPEKEEDLFLFEEESASQSFDHLEIGTKINCLEYKNSFIYFLKNEAALFELAVAEFFINKFSNPGFLRFSNPDFTRNVLAEGVGVPPDDFTELFLLEETESNNDNLHLCGGASLFPFCGYHAKHSVPKHSLPIKFIAQGRRYNPITNSMPGLYSVNQSTSVQVFVATFGEEELYQEFQASVQVLSDIYRSLGLKFKIVSKPPHCFKSWESLRVSFQVFSPHQKTFVEVGHLSLIGDFISKRLKMCYSDNNKEPFLQVLSGTVVNAQTLLALCLERSHNRLFIPEVLKDFLI